MKRVLLLTASFGDRHTAAASNLSDALEMLSTEAKVEIVDLFQPGFGSLGTMARRAYNGLMRLAPALWGGFNGLRDQPLPAETAGFSLGRLQRALGHFLQEAQPDVVGSTYPVYVKLIQELYQDHAEQPFRLVSIITDPASVDTSWLQGPSDLYCVRNGAAAAQLRRHSVPEERIRICGFPVTPLSSRLSDVAPPDPGSEGPYRILYLVEPGKRKLGKRLKKILEREENHLTIAVGRNAYLKAELTKKLKRYGQRVQVLGWTNQMPHLMRVHHLVIGNPSGAVVEEAIAACCPMIATQASIGREEEALSLNDSEIGAVASKPRHLAEWLKHAFKREAKLWRRWRENLLKMSRPQAALEIARILLEECDRVNDSKAPAVQVPSSDTFSAAAFPLGHVRPLLCDFHIHTNYSDGKLTVAEVVDFYGSRHFDCICVTDHLADSRRLIGKLGKLSRLTLSPNQLEEYFEVIERERRRAWRKYNMLVMTGLEFNKDGLSKKSSAHLLGIDLNMPIIDCLDLPETIAHIHAQGGLAVASHPHIMKSEWGKNTLYLWENQEQFIRRIDAWEIANRNNMFNPVSAKRLPYLANSDFHKPKHIYSWKTLVSCEKDAEAIKDCIRKNERIAITLYRERDSAVQWLATDSKAGTNPTVVCADPRGASPLLPAA
jgi:predicted metal-dependent phosphoesterase TrpH